MEAQPHDASSPRRVLHLATSDDAIRFGLLPQLGRLREDGWDVIAATPVGPWVSQFEAAGIRHLAWPGLTTRGNLLLDLQAVRGLAEYVPGASAPRSCTATNRDPASSGGSSAG